MFIRCLEGEKHSPRIIIQAIKYYRVNIKEALEQMVGNQLHFILYTICVNHSYCTKHEYTWNFVNNTKVTFLFVVVIVVKTTAVWFLLWMKSILWEGLRFWPVSLPSSFPLSTPTPLPVSINLEKQLDFDERSRKESTWHLLFSRPGSKSQLSCGDLPSCPGHHHPLESPKKKKKKVSPPISFSSPEDEFSLSRLHRPKICWSAFSL